MKKIIFVLSIGLLFTLTSCDKKTQKKVKAKKSVEKEAKKTEKSIKKALD